MIDDNASSELATCLTVGNALSDSATISNVAPACENAIQECARKFHAASGHAVDAAESLVQLIGPDKTLSEYQKHHSYATFKDHVKRMLLERYIITRRMLLIQEGTIAHDDAFPFENIIQLDCKDFNANYQVRDLGKKRLALLKIERAVGLKHIYDSWRLVDLT
jgi:hypothetical protein